MKKVILSLSAACLLINGLKAQTFNSSYELPGYNVSYSNIAVSDDGSEIFTASSLIEDPSSGGELDLLLTKLDAAGNVLNSVKLRGISPFMEVNTGNKLIRTSDGGVLFIGTQNLHTTIIRFDNTLNQVWAKTVPENLNFVDYSGYSLVTVPAAGGKGNDYIIAAPVLSPYSGTYTSDEAIMAMRINDITGNIYWKNIYADAARGSNPAATISDRVSSIVSSPLPGDKGRPKEGYVLSGTRQETIGISPFDYLFTLRIDGNGNVMGKFNRYTTAGNQVFKNQVNMIVDQRGNLAAVYTENNNNIAPTTGGSLIGLIRFTPALVPIDNVVYWQSGYSENYGYSINQLSNSDYLINAREDVNTGSSSYTMVGALEVDMSTLAPLSFYNYNYGTSQDYVYLDGGKIDASDYNYVAANPLVSAGSGIYSKLRVIKDNGGATCEASTGDINYLPIQNITDNYNYNAFPGEANEDVSYDQEDVTLNVYSCTGNKSTGVAGVIPSGKKDVNVYPSLLQSATGAVHCDLTGDFQGTSEITVYNALGQKVYSRSFDAAENKLSFDGKVLSSGLNILSVTNNGVLVKQAKIVVAE